jgi:hypothetical protein
MQPRGKQVSPLRRPGTSPHSLKHALDRHASDSKLKAQQRAEVSERRQSGRLLNRAGAAGSEDLLADPDAMSGPSQLQLTQQQSGGSSGETSALLGGRGSGRPDYSSGSSPPFKAPPSDKDSHDVQHRCGRSGSLKPFVFASITIGAGSFGQGCVHAVAKPLLCRG